MDARTGRTVGPPALVSDEKIEMTPRELKSFAVQVVREQLADAGRELMSWSDNPGVSPSLWFVGDAGPEWVVVAAGRYPAGEALPPANFADLRRAFTARGGKRHFASVTFADSRQGTSAGDEPMLLYRGYGMQVAYGGLEGEGGGLAS